MKLKRKNLGLIIFYGLAIVIGGQVMAYYLYKTINLKTDKFISDEIRGEKIINFDTLRYTPGKGKYTDFVLSNKKNYPLFLEDDNNENQILINSVVNKKPNERNFQIRNGDRVYYFTIRKQESQNILRLFLFVITSAVAISTFYKFGIEKKN